MADVHILRRPAQDRVGRRLAAVVSADVVGYSRLVERDEEDTVRRLKRYFQELVRPAVAEHGGRVVKLMGDGALLEFPSVVEAVRCSLLIQEEVAAAEAGQRPDERIRYRVGIHLGDVIVDGEDIQGHGVNVAARLQGLAEPGGICVSDAVRAALGSSVAISFKDLGPQEVKNIAEPVRAYHVLGAAASKTVRAKPRRLALPASLTAAAAVAAVALAAVALAYAFGFIGRDGDPGLVTPAAAVPGIAVLPFLNMSEDKSQEFFVDGLTEDLIIDLSNLSGLFVISRNTAFTYKGQTVKPQEIAEELGVTHVLNGSVRRAGSQVRITAQLVEAKADRQIWSGRYDRELIDIFGVQDEVKKEIIAALQVTLTPSEQLQSSATPTKNIQAYEYYLRGRQAIAGATTFRSKSLAFWNLEKAISLDPSFAEAHAALALTHFLDFNSGTFTAWWSRSPHRSRAQALALAQKAALLKPELSIPEIVLARLSYWDGEYDDAINHARRAVEHEPGNVDAHATHAHVLTAAGLHREAKTAIDEVFRRDPKPSAQALGLRGAIEFALRDYAAAIDSLTQARAISPEGPPFAEFLFAAYGQAGRKAEAQTVRLAFGETIVSYAVAKVLFWGFYRKREDAEHLGDGLRKAGAPELPLGFDPAIDAAGPLTGAELQSLLFGKSFAAQCMAEMIPGTIRVAANGAISWILRDDLTDSGTSRVNGDRLCMTLPLFTWGGETCLSGYRNTATPRFDLGRGYEFVFVGPDLCYFSRQ